MSGIGVLGIDNVLFDVGDLDGARRFYGPAPPRPSPRLWLEVPNARAAAAVLGDAGVDLLDEPRELRTGWVVELSDPWGNVIGLTDYLNDPARARQAAAGR